MSQQPALAAHDSFANLAAGNPALQAGGLRPLAWIDGMLTAAMVSPEFVDPELWIEHVCDEAVWARFTGTQMERFIAALTARQIHIGTQLAEDPESYRPFLDGGPDQLTAASDWAAGFRVGIRVQPEPWQPIIDDDAGLMLLNAIFVLESDESLAGAEDAENPFAGITPERRREMRASGVEMLAAVVLALHEASAHLVREGTLPPRA
jgi:yecA family protein